eukprot:3303173-Rhodomonas_salina.1
MGQCRGGSSASRWYAPHAVSRVLVGLCVAALLRVDQVNSSSAFALPNQHAGAKYANQPSFSAACFASYLPCAHMPARTMSSCSPQLSFSTSGGGMGRRIQSLHQTNCRTGTSQLRMGGEVDLRKADEEGSRLFVRGISDAVDTARLKATLDGLDGLVQVVVAKPGLGYAVFADPLAAEDAIPQIEEMEIDGCVPSACARALA